jgi:hypothetical protein
VEALITVALSGEAVVGFPWVIEMDWNVWRTQMAKK